MSIDLDRLCASPALPCRENLPEVFRMVSIERYPAGDWRFRSRAVLFHELANLTVEWYSGHVDTRLVAGCLVSLRLKLQWLMTGDALQIERLVLLEIPVSALNLFATIPPNWVRDRELITRGQALWTLLPRYFQHLFNAMLWDGKRFQRFVMGPSSMNGHHAERNGNLRHSLEVAERALEIAKGEQDICHPVLIMAALIHDAGKADEYEYDYPRQRFSLSARGVLIGHRHTVIEWLAAATARNQVNVPELQYLALLHALTSARGAPAWLGIREPRSLEATTLSAADRLSGESDLVHRLAPTSDGFGRYHKHLRGRPFVVRHTACEGMLV